MNYFKQVEIFFVCLHTVTNDLIVGQVKRKLKRQKEMDVNN